MSKKGAKKQKNQCSVCGKYLANPLAKSHINSKVHQDALKKEFVAPKPVPKTEPIPEISDPTSLLKALDNRILNLENQISDLFLKLTILDSRFSLKSKTLNVSDLDSVKSYLKQILPGGHSVSVDELAKSNYLEQYNWTLIERAVQDLIDDDDFEFATGDSRKTILGYIGRITRKE